MSDLCVTELRAGRARVRIAPALGGRLTGAWLEGPDNEVLPVLHPYPETETCLLPWARGGIYPLIPYSGRIRQALLLYEGRRVPLTAHPGGGHHTLHGISHQRAWSLTYATHDHAVLRYQHTSDSNWPWNFEASLAITLVPQRLHIALSLLNTDTREMPGGIGLHPYFPYLNGSAVKFVAGQSWPCDADHLGLPAAPTGAPRCAVNVSATQFETGEVTLHYPEWVGEATLRRSDGTCMHLLADGNLDHLVIHRPENGPYVCMEPVSHVADGFNLYAGGVHGTGTKILAPGEALHGAVQIGCSIDS